MQNSQNRDASAFQAKLDELIRSVDAARNQFIGIEDRTDREIQKIRSELEAECGQSDHPSHETVERLISRR